MHHVVVLAIVVAVVLAGPASVAAEHMTLMPAESEPAREPARETSNLDVDLRVGGDSFRFGGRLFGRGGVSGAWLNGQMRPDGLTVDGRVQTEARAHNFRFNIGFLDPLSRTVARWWLAP
jgi:hypothetical protein